MNPFLITLVAVSIGISLIEDLQHQKIPNVVTYPTMALAVGYHSFSGGFNGLSFSSGGLALGIALFIVPYLLGGMGAGDLKLMGAAGAIFGPKGICIASILVVLAGGVYGLILFAMHPRYSLSFLRRLWGTFRTFVLTKQLVLIPRGIDEKQPVVHESNALAVSGTGAGDPEISITQKIQAMQGHAPAMAFPLRGIQVLANVGCANGHGKGEKMLSPWPLHCKLIELG